MKIYIYKYDLYGNNNQNNILKIDDDLIGYWQGWPRLAIENGNIIVVWTDYRNTGYKYQASGYPDIYGQRFDLNLNKIGNNFKVSHQPNCSSRDFPSVILQNNKIVSVWLDGRSKEYLPVMPPEVKANIWGTIQDFNDPLPGNIMYCPGDTIVPDTTIHQDTTINNLHTIEYFEVFPNPTSNKLNINIKISSPSQMKISVFNILGAEVIKLIDCFYNFTTFNHSYYLNDLSSGVYIIELSIFDSAGRRESKSKKIIIIK